MFKNQKRIEPFVGFVNNEIKSKKEALDVIKKNLYYMNFVAGFSFFLFMFSIYKAYINSVYPSPLGLVVAIIFFGLSYYINKFISKVAALILIVINISLVLVTVYLFTQGGSLGLMFLLVCTLLSASLRIYKAVSFHNKN